MFMMLTGPDILTDSATCASFSILSNLFPSPPFTYLSVIAKLCGPLRCVDGNVLGPATDRLFGLGLPIITLLRSIFKFGAKYSSTDFVFIHEKFRIIRNLNLSKCDNLDVFQIHVLEYFVSELHITNFIFSNLT